MAAGLLAGLLAGLAANSGASFFKKGYVIKSGWVTAFILLSMGGVEKSHGFLQRKLNELDSSYDGYRVLVTGTVSEDDMEQIHRTIDYIPY